MESIKLLSLNIGNPSLTRAVRQCEWLSKRDEDVFVLTETKNSQGCSFIEDFFLNQCHTLFDQDSKIEYDVRFPRSVTGDLGVMIICKHRIVDTRYIFENNSIYYSRQLESSVQYNNMALNIMGLYVPSRDRTEKKIQRKKNFIDDIIKNINTSAKSTSIIMGDLNILDQKHFPHYSTFYKWEYDFYDDIIKCGYKDAYRLCNPTTNDYSWIGRTGDGYRYDYCFVSDDLIQNVISCSFDHETRNLKLTDHSAITIELFFNKINK